MSARRPNTQAPINTLYLTLTYLFDACYKRSTQTQVMYHIYMISVHYLHKHRPVMAYRRYRNLQDIHPSSQMTSGRKECSVNKCSIFSHCQNIVESSTFSNAITTATDKCQGDFDCTSNNVIYMISLMQKM